MDVVTTPPDGHDPDVPGRRSKMPNCRHVFVPKPSPANLPTGKMVCLLCRIEVPAGRQREEAWAPAPRDTYTGY